jgi:hypothetical protein
LVTEGLRVDFAFVDGHHLFDYVVTECLFLGKLLPRGGLLVVDDANLPAIGRACDFFSTNRGDFEEITEATRPGVLRRLFRSTLPPPRCCDCSGGSRTMTRETGTTSRPSDPRGLPAAGRPVM